MKTLFAKFLSLTMPVKIISGVALVAVVGGVITVPFFLNENMTESEKVAIMEQAKQAMDVEEYDKAIELYEEILQADSPDEETMTNFTKASLLQLAKLDEQKDVVLQQEIVNDILLYSVAFQKGIESQEVNLEKLYEEEQS